MSTTANWLGNFVVAMIAPVLFQYITFWTYILFAFMNVIFIPMVYFWFPETKGLPLEQVEILFATEEIKDDARSMAFEREHHDVERIGVPDNKPYISNK
jgi:hypothetical protein